jgi:regulator of protease activity HflC (stomatin/prohibitin superfamily)
MFSKVIHAGEIGLVFRNGAFKRMITEGRSYVSPFETVYVYDKARPFIAPVNIDILLQDVTLAHALEIVQVKDNEIALYFENGLFKEVLAPGRYVYWKGGVSRKIVITDLNSMEIPAEIDTMLLVRKELYPYIRIFGVESYEAGLLFVKNKFERMIEPGCYYFWKNTTPVSVLKVDRRQLQMEISGQEILTKDKANLRLNFVAQYKVVDAMKAVLENKEYEKQLYITLQLAFREYIGHLGFDELLEKKDAVSAAVSKAVAEKAAALGVEMVSCGIRDIILPGEVKDIMNQVLIAEKKAQANTIMRREETASTRSLLNTAKLMEDNQMLFKLKEMEYVEKIAEKINNISLSGGSLLVDQLKDIFVPGKK